MPDLLKAPYAHISISAPLTDTEYATIRNADLTATTMDAAGTTATIGSTTITTVDYKDYAAVIINPSYVDETRLTGSDEAVRHAQGRSDFEMRLNVFNNNVPVDTLALLQNMRGPRLYYVEIHGEHFTCIGNAMNANEQDTGNWAHEYIIRNYGSMDAMWAAIS